MSLATTVCWWFWGFPQLWSVGVKDLSHLGNDWNNCECSIPFSLLHLWWCKYKIFSLQVTEIWEISYKGQVNFLLKRRFTNTSDTEQNESLLHKCFIITNQDCDMGTSSKYSESGKYLHFSLTSHCWNLVL